MVAELGLHLVRPVWGCNSELGSFSYSSIFMMLGLFPPHEDDFLFTYCGTTTFLITSLIHSRQTLCLRTRGDFFLKKKKAAPRLAKNRPFFGGLISTDRIAAQHSPTHAQIIHADDRQDLRLL